MSFQRYPKYKDSGVEWLGRIPIHWEVWQSRRLFSLRTERARAEDEQLTASQKYGVLPQKIFMELEEQRVVQVLLNSEILKHVEPGDFVISMRSFQGGIEYAPYGGCISSAYVMLIPKPTINANYFKYLFKSQTYVQALQSTTNLVRDGQALRFQNFSLVALPKVPIDEQGQISSFLDRETAKIDVLVKEQRRLIELLKEKRQAVISNAVTKGLNPHAPLKPSAIQWPREVPAEWTVKRIKNLVNERDGIQMGPFGGMLLDLDSEDTGFKVYGQENTISGNFDLGSRWLSFDRFSALSNYHIRPGDLLLTRKGSLGNARLVETLPPTRHHGF